MTVQFPFVFLCQRRTTKRIEIYCCHKKQIKIRGEAEAFAISAKAKAEAEQMAKKAEAWREYREAAMVDMLLETLPKVIEVNRIG